MYKANYDYDHDPENDYYTSYDHLAQEMYDLQEVSGVTMKKMTLTACGSIIKILETTMYGIVTWLK